jgi:hypothetical protein
MDGPKEFLMKCIAKLMTDKEYGKRGSNEKEMNFL